MCVAQLAPAKHDRIDEKYNFYNIPPAHAVWWSDALIWQLARISAIV